MFLRFLSFFFEIGPLQIFVSTADMTGVLTNRLVPKVIFSLVLIITVIDFLFLKFYCIFGYITYSLHSLTKQEMSSLATNGSVMETDYCNTFASVWKIRLLNVLQL